MRIFCTYFDHNYLPRGLALHSSISKHCPEFKLWVLCLSGDCHQALKRLDLPHVMPVTLNELEQFEPRLTAARQNRSAIEYFFTCTPVLPLFVLAHEPAASDVTYVDCDMLVYQPLDELWDEIGDHSIAIVPHRFPAALLDLERYGIFNVGWLTFRRDTNARACLEWWRDRCLEWCYDRLEEGRFADQKYLDDWPERFSGLKVICHPGVNLAPWNLAAHRIECVDDRIMVDGRPLLIFHFHGVRQRARCLFDPQLHRYGVLHDELLTERIYRPYLRQLTAFAAKAGLRKEDAGLNPRGVSEADSALELSLRQKWIERNQQTHQANFGGYMTVSPASVGVVILTFNSAHQLPAHLASMEPWLDLVDEIIVVDSHSTDGSIELIRERLRHPNLRILLHPPGSCHPLNHGINHLESDFTYISKIGDTITRHGLQHLLATAQQFACDIVVSPPRLVFEPCVTQPQHLGVIETVLNGLGIASPVIMRRDRIWLHAVHHALDCGFQGVLGKSVGNLYRTEMLQAMPFSDELIDSGETMWGIRNLLAASLVISPRCNSTALICSDDPISNRQQRVKHELSRVPDIARQAVEEALAQSFARDQNELLTAKEAVESMIKAAALRRSYLEHCEELKSLRSTMPVRSLWFLHPRAWRVRRERNRLRKRLQEAEVMKSGLQKL